jgi:hypothetical protein
VTGPVPTTPLGNVVGNLLGECTSVGESDRGVVSVVRKSAWLGLKADWSIDLGHLIELQHRLNGIMP